MVFHADTLVPLGEDHVATRISFQLWSGDGEAKEGQRLGVANSGLAVEFEPVTAPIGPEGLEGDGLAGFGEVVRRGGVGPGKRTPVAALRLQRFHPQMAELYI